METDYETCDAFLHHKCPFSVLDWFLNSKRSLWIKPRLKVINRFYQIPFIVSCLKSSFFLHYKMWWPQGILAQVIACSTIASMGVGCIITLLLVAEISIKCLGHGENGTHEFTHKWFWLAFSWFLASFTESSQNTVMAIGTPAESTNTRVKMHYWKIIVRKGIHLNASPWCLSP